ncbi:NifU family protein [Rickettsiales endosymbiont of Peranema trichophorum]|uniref:NifU family protein n=1 Tax=Rickettsiales endosymbiont of Peranema trichophorum TaxID=2486577 RepID=UPI00102330B2|nr:NifU family protein [Rickettsiales endosymbiont of Peranema trichophorum]RZI47733.1 NifU family protein [Rickettsiales endosymbiont of Peranema trichophorum]
MLIQTQLTPNPNTLKILLPQQIVKRGVFAFNNTQKDLESLPVLIRNILSVDGVDSILITVEFMTVTKIDTWDWNVVKPLVLSILMDSISTGTLAIEASVLEPIAHEDTQECVDDHVVKQIKELLDTKVRPAVAQDGGDITYRSFKDGVLYVELRGACSGCPSSSVTLKSGIENMMRYYIPEVLSVESV